MPIIPPFDSDGLLPPGDYELSFDELRQSGLVRGGGKQNTDSTWDAVWREQLVGGLEILARQLWQVGIREIFADGSFVEDKDHPNDIDGYFVCDLKSLASGVLAQQLNRLDPYKVWTWDPASRTALSRLSQAPASHVASLSGRTVSARARTWPRQRHPRQVRP